MQIAKEPLLYHLCAAAVKGQRRLKQFGGMGQREGKRYKCALTGYIMHQLNVPTAKFHQNPEDLLSCCPSESLHWLISNHLLPLLLEGFGDFEAAKKKKYYGPLEVLVDASPSIMHPGVVNRLFLCVFVVHILV